jgi:hypothetical protein
MTMVTSRFRVAAGAVAAFALLFSALPAHADTSAPAADNLAEFSEFADSLHTSPGRERALEAAFADLGPEAQGAFLDQLSEDPAEVFQVEEVSTSATPVAMTKTAGPRIVAASARGTRALKAAHTADVRVLGIVVGRFGIDYRYEATSTDVIRTLACSGWWDGFGLTGSAKETSYVARGRGTCSVRHSMSVVIKGSPISFTKLHTLTTASRNPKQFAGSITSI